MRVLGFINQQVHEHTSELVDIQPLVFMPQIDHYDHSAHTCVTACCTWPPLWHVLSNHTIFCNKSLWSLEHIVIPPVHFLYAELDEAQAGIKIAGRNINNLRYADDTTLMAESEEELKSLSMKVKEENEKVGLKLNIQKMKIMASGLITSWQIDGETVETESDFIFGGCKITADGDCSHEIKRLTPWKKSYEQPR